MQAETRFWHVRSVLTAPNSHCGQRPMPPLKVTPAFVIEWPAGSAHLTRYAIVFRPASVVMSPLVSNSPFVFASPLVRLRPFVFARPLVFARPFVFARPLIPLIPFVFAK